VWSGNQRDACGRYVPAIHVYRVPNGRGPIGSFVVFFSLGARSKLCNLQLTFHDAAKYGGWISQPGHCIMHAVTHPAWQLSNDLSISVTRRHDNSTFSSIAVDDVAHESDSETKLDFHQNLIKDEKEVPGKRPRVSRMLVWFPIQSPIVHLQDMWIACSAMESSTNHVAAAEKAMIQFTDVVAESELAIQGETDHVETDRKTVTDVRWVHVLIEPLDGRHSVPWSRQACIVSAWRAPHKPATVPSASDRVTALYNTVCWLVLSSHVVLYVIKAAVMRGCNIFSNVGCSLLIVEYSAHADCPVYCLFSKCYNRDMTSNFSNPNNKPVVIEHCNFHVYE